VRRVLIDNKGSQKHKPPNPYNTKSNITSLPNTFLNFEMPSSKGKPTDPELREELKEEIKQEPNKSGGGQGQWSAWKV
jgi:hypothetical protein